MSDGEQFRYLDYTLAAKSRKRFCSSVVTRFDFSTSAEAMHNPQKATEDFHAAFAAHQCKEDASQAAARIVREATEGR
jgi:hypothetical protein